MMSRSSKARSYLRIMARTPLLQPHCGFKYATIFKLLIVPQVLCSHLTPSSPRTNTVYRVCRVAPAPPAPAHSSRPGPKSCHPRNLPPSAIVLPWMVMNLTEPQSWRNPAGGPRRWRGGGQRVGRLAFGLSLAFAFALVLLPGAATRAAGTEPAPGTRRMAERL